MNHLPYRCLRGIALFPAIAFLATWPMPSATAADHHVTFDIRSVRDGPWSSPRTWSPARLPAAGERVLIGRGTQVTYDLESEVVHRMIQVAGTLRFARDRDTRLDVGILKVQESEHCSEDGFACDFDGINEAGEPESAPAGAIPSLEIGTPAAPIPAPHTARIRLHFLEGMDRNDAPAIACCSARMEIHGQPMNRTWVKLAKDAEAGDHEIWVAEEVTGWKAGDTLLVTSSNRADPGAEEREVARVEGRRIRLSRALEHSHSGSGEFRCEVANLTRNVIIESADPGGVRGHTVYHRFSRGGISYARFAHLGKRGVLGRYPIHFHRVKETMRGSAVVGAAVVDSHNRWVTIHGTDYLMVRDCVGHGSVGHGFFLEDGTEVYALLDRNLGVQARDGRRLPGQVLSFDPNDGAAFWWGNGRNTLVRNVACENDTYGFRYDMKRTSAFSSTLPVRMPDGEVRRIDVRTIPIWRFEGNESHSEGLYGMLVAANGDSQPDSPIRSEAMLRRIRQLDWTGPDPRHPHVIRDLKIWDAHYAFRPHSPCMLIEGLRLHRTAYGVYRPALDRHVYRDVHPSDIGPEPFNRGMDDASAQNGSFTVDGPFLEGMGHAGQNHPIIHMTDNALQPGAEAHFRNVTVRACDPRRPIFNRGGSVRADPFVANGVPYYLHDHFGEGRAARIVSTRAKDLMAEGEDYREEPPWTGDESRLTQVSDVEFPRLLDPVDDLPPATIIRSVRRGSGVSWTVSGVSHDNGRITSVSVNGQQASLERTAPGVVDWTVTVGHSADGILRAEATDDAGNREQTPHLWRLSADLSLR